MKKKNRKKNKVGMRVVLSIVLVLLALCVGVTAFVVLKLNKINRVDKDTESQIPQAEETFESDAEDAESDLETIDAEDVEWDDIALEDDEEIKNILLIGQDRRSGQGRQRSDSMIICSLNTKTNEITLVSLMRDMYVQIPGYSDNRINAAYAFGGMSLLDTVIETNFGVEIDGNIEVDFEGFVGAMSKIGNLDIELYQEEADYLNKQNSSWHLKAGMNSLTPEQALMYARTRHVGHADYERTERQRTVLKAAFSKIKDLGITEMVSLADELLPYFTTDLSNTEILSYAYTVAANKMQMGESYRIPIDGAYKSARIRGMAVLVPDLSANSEALKKYLYGEE